MKRSAVAGHEKRKACTVQERQRVGETRLGSPSARPLGCPSGRLSGCPLGCPSGHLRLSLRSLRLPFRLSLRSPPPVSQQARGRVAGDACTTPCTPSVPSRFVSLTLNFAIGCVVLRKNSGFLFSNDRWLVGEVNFPPSSETRASSTKTP